METGPDLHRHPLRMQPARDDDPTRPEGGDRRRRPPRRHHVCRRGRIRSTSNRTIGTSTRSSLAARNFSRSTAWTSHVIDCEKDKAAAEGLITANPSRPAHESAIQEPPHQKLVNAAGSPSISCQPFSRRTCSPCFGPKTAAFHGEQVRRLLRLRKLMSGCFSDRRHGGLGTLPQIPMPPYRRLLNESRH